MNRTQKHSNRYNDEYVFTLLDNGNVLWSGPFDWCRMGWPNVYERSYEAYTKDFKNQEFSESSMDIDELLTLEEFKEAVHEDRWYIDESWVNPLEKYRELIYSDTETIDMVDPSGGPYICVGMDIGRYLEGVVGLIMKMIHTEEGWELVIG
jgi:hypothetical protein